MPVRTVLPFHVTSRGPTFTESNRDIRTSKTIQYRCALPVTSRSGAIHVENLSADMARLGKIKHSVNNIPYRRLLYSRLQRRFGGIISAHWCIHNAGGNGIE